MPEIADVISESIENARDEETGGPKEEGRLNSIIALLVAITATFTALCNVKDGNICQAMAQAQANAVDAWSYYQAKGTKLNLAEATLDQLTLERDLHPELGAEGRAHLDRKIAEYGGHLKTFEGEKVEIKAKAEEYQREYDRLNMRDDQFDLAEALLSVAIALFGITALTRKRFLLVFAIVLGGLGIVFGMAGFAGWKLHPDFLTSLLS